MAAWIVFIAGLILAVAILFAGGWILRGLRDRYRAEVARDRAWDDPERCRTGTGGSAL